MAYSKVDNFSEEELRKIVSESTSIREVCRKVGYTYNGQSQNVVKSRLEKYNISTDHFSGTAKEKIERNESNIFIENSTATQATLRRWYLKGNYTPYKCSICGLEPFWNGKELTLTLDHINGSNHDDRLENLRWVCPNCDRQLDTFGSKNKKGPVAQYMISKKENPPQNVCIDCGKIISKYATRCVECDNKYRIAHNPNRPEQELLVSILKQYHGNFTKVGEFFNVSDNAVRKWCKVYNLPFHSSDYK